MHSAFFRLRRRVKQRKLHQQRKSERRKMFQVEKQSEIVCCQLFCVAFYWNDDDANNCNVIGIKTTDAMKMRKKNRMFGNANNRIRTKFRTIYHLKLVRQERKVLFFGSIKNENEAKPNEKIVWKQKHVMMCKAERTTTKKSTTNQTKLPHEENWKSKMTCVWCHFGSDFR